jgi:hypothetical protein
MPRQPGQPVAWYNVDDGIWHPGTVEFECCQASIGGPFTVVKDEFGNEHLLTGDLIKPSDPSTLQIVGRQQGPLREVRRAVVQAAKRRGLVPSPGMPSSKLDAKGGR